MLDAVLAALHICICRLAQQLPSLAEQALALSSPVKLQDSLPHSSATDAPAAHIQSFGTQAASLDFNNSTGAPSWLTPQQLQNRQLGKFVACDPHLAAL